MRPEQLSDAIGELPDELLSARAGRKPRRWPTLVAAAACLVLVAAALWGSGGLTPAADPSESEASSDGTPTTTGPRRPTAAVSTTPKTAATTANTANTVQTGVRPATLPATETDRAGFALAGGKQARCIAAAAAVKPQAQPLTEAKRAMTAFTKALLPAMLAGDAQNRACSPQDLYLSLAMLAETADGSSRAQLLQLLGCADTAALRQTVTALWDTQTRAGSNYHCVPAVSLWLPLSAGFRADTVDRLAGSYHASVFSGDMGSAAYNTLFADWLSQSTGGLLGTADAPKFDGGTSLALCSTLSYQAMWNTKFDKKDTRDGVFHADGGDCTVPFLRRSRAHCPYYAGKRFSAVSLELVEGYSGIGKMWLILPQEGVSPEDIAGDAALLSLLCGEAETVNAEVELAVPRFDVSARQELIPVLQKLGVGDVADRAKADFSPLTGDRSLHLSAASQSVRVAADETGVSAASLSYLAYAGANTPVQKITFTLDRPFLFAVCGKDGIVRFAGTVHTP